MKCSYILRSHEPLCGLTLLALVLYLFLQFSLKNSILFIIIFSALSYLPVPHIPQLCTQMNQWSTKPSFMKITAGLKLLYFSPFEKAQYGGKKKRLTHLRTEYGYKTFFLIERVHDEREYFLVYFSLFLVY